MTNNQNLIMFNWNDACYDPKPSIPWSDSTLYDNNNSHDCPPGTTLHLPTILPGRDNYGHIQRQTA